MTQTYDEKLQMVDAMHRYGGSFVIALAECFIRADAHNLDRLYQAFPEIVARYIQIARDSRAAEARPLDAPENDARREEGRRQ